MTYILVYNNKKFLMLNLFILSIKSLLIYEENKPIFSCFALSVLILCAYFYSSFFLNLRFAHIDKALVLTIFVILILGWISVFYKPYYFNYQLYTKSVFPFGVKISLKIFMVFILL